MFPIVESMYSSWLPHVMAAKGICRGHTPPHLLSALCWREIPRHTRCPACQIGWRAAIHPPLQTHTCLMMGRMSCPSMGVAPASPVPSTMSPLLNMNRSFPCTSRMRRMRDQRCVAQSPLRQTPGEEAGSERASAAAAAHTWACAMPLRCWKKASTSG